MKKLIIIIILFSSCSTFKSLTSNDKGTKDTVTEVIETTKKGGITTLEIPNIIRKDTTIYTVNRDTKTILTTIFDKNGKQRIECLEAELSEKITRIEEAIQNDIEVKDIKESKFNPQYLIYSIAGLGVVLIIGMIVFSAMIINIKKSIIN